MKAVQLADIPKGAAGGGGRADAPEPVSIFNLISFQLSIRDLINFQFDQLDQFQIWSNQ